MRAKKEGEPNLRAKKNTKEQGREGSDRERES
jgi:hypothetical protein